MYVDILNVCCLYIGIGCVLIYYKISNKNSDYYV